MRKTSKILAPALALGMAFGASGVSANAETVTIGEGDTLNEIAQQYDGVTLDDLFDMNPTIDPYDLEIGTEVKISTSNDDSYGETFHTVEPGSTLNSIANLHKGVTLNDLYDLNPGIDPYNLTIGSEVRVSDDNDDSSKETYHTVEPSSTLYGIAQLHEGVSLNDLYELNPRIDPYDLEVGSEVKVR